MIGAPSGAQDCERFAKDRLGIRIVAAAVLEDAQAVQVKRNAEMTPAEVRGVEINRLPEQRGGARGLVAAFGERTTVHSDRDRVGMGGAKLGVEDALRFFEGVGGWTEAFHIEQEQAIVVELRGIYHGPGGLR